MDDDFEDHPDWGRVLVPPGSQIQPVGDPTRWGAQGLTLLPVPAVFSVSTAGTQIIQAATKDGYSRSWALVGTLSLPTLLWDDLATNTIVTLQIQMGVGQAQVLHEIELIAGIGLMTGATKKGLCASQDEANGGPYRAYLSAPLSSVAGVTDTTRGFAAIGALVGATINIRASYRSTSLAYPAVYPCQSQINLLLTPFAAGHGL